MDYNYFDQLPNWLDMDHSIVTSVLTDGTSGNDWIKRLENRNVILTESAKTIIKQKTFKPTKDIRFTLEILKGGQFENGFKLSDIKKFAKNQLLLVPSIEIALLMREQILYNDMKEMGLDRIIIMHRSHKGRLLSLELDGYASMITTVKTEGRWQKNDGFAFIINNIE